MVPLSCGCVLYRCWIELTSCLRLAPLVRKLACSTHISVRHLMNTCIASSTNLPAAFRRFSTRFCSTFFVSLIVNCASLCCCKTRNKWPISHLLPLFMVALCNRADRYIFTLWFLSFFFLFFPRLISAVKDWMSTILPHMVWQCEFRMHV